MKHIYICTSKIHGLGINAGEDIKKGEVINRIKGPVKFKINKDKDDALDNPDWVGISKNQWVDPERPHKFLNHSCNPSAGMRGLTLYALRDIGEGQEITIDYAIIEGDDRWEMKCTCGAPNCRKIVRSIHFLPQKAFNKYLPYIPAYFKKLYEEHGELNIKKKIV